MKESRVKILRLTAWLVASAMFVSLSSEAVVRAAQRRNRIAKVQPKTAVTETEQKAKTTKASEEYKAFWFSFYDYDEYRDTYKKNNASNFKKYFTKVVNKGKSLGMNLSLIHI